MEEGTFREEIKSEIPLVTSPHQEVVAAVHREQSHNTSISSSTSQDKLSSPNGSKLRSDAGRTKQKRNKPTLSCAECVERKTKCDRARPVCTACIKRSSNCHYTPIANIIATTEEPTPRKRRFSEVSTAVAPPAAETLLESSGSTSNGGWAATIRASFTKPLIQANVANSVRKLLRGPLYPTKDLVQLNSLTMENSAPLSVFGIGSEHPFGNYWTSTGGMSEVIGVMPRKEQADILVQTYFESMDPMYPCLDRTGFIAAYQEFWAGTHEEQVAFDAPMIALHFVIYANATLFMQHGERAQRTGTAEFYISAAHQALRISSYWSHISITTIQAMVLTFTFLVNNDHPQDAWVLSGIAARQACVLQLNRDPDQIVPDATAEHKTLRLTIWSMVMAQDCGIALFLKLPPSSLINDVSETSYDSAYRGIDTITSSDARLDLRPLSSLPPDSRRNDLTILRCVWQMNTFMQKHILVKRALGQPICTSPEHKKSLVDSYRALYRSYPPPFNSHNPSRFFTTNDFRLARQLVGFATLFFHPLLLMHADVNPAAGVGIDVYGALEAGHEVLIGFFAMNEMFGSDGFWSVQHRSFEVALSMANLLASIAVSGTLPNAQDSNIETPPSHILATAKEDVRRMLDMIRVSSGYFEYQSIYGKNTSRLDTLRAVYQKITIA